MRGQPNPPFLNIGIVTVALKLDSGLAFSGHGKTSIGLRLNPEGLGQKAGAVISTNRIADLNNLLPSEEPTELSEGRIIDVTAIGHLLHVTKQGPLLVIK